MPATRVFVPSPYSVLKTSIRPWLDMASVKGMVVINTLLSLCAQISTLVLTSRSSKALRSPLSPLLCNPNLEAFHTLLVNYREFSCQHLNHVEITGGRSTCNWGEIIFKLRITAVD